jgi:phosphoglycerate dehydrogenase-like enzyme
MGKWASFGWSASLRCARILASASVSPARAAARRSFASLCCWSRLRGGRPAENVDEMFAPDRAEELLERSDYVMNVLPSTAETKSFMSAARFSHMKKTACYVSAGRGATTDQDALIDALKAGKIACAGLDVTTPEPLPADSPLWDMDNVILTPHMAGHTDRYFERATGILIENLKSYINAGAPCKNIVDCALQY